MNPATLQIAAPSRPGWLGRFLGAPPVLALLLFALFLPVYWFSVPTHFNTVYENRRFFDSDGEFITRQYAQNRAATHNDHLLYHVLARRLHVHANRLPGVPNDPVLIHKGLSVGFGAASVALAFTIAWTVLRRRTDAVLLALLAGGSASAWFFSATIDTYIPSLCMHWLALLCALEQLRRGSVAGALGLGAALGLAFLFRTDSIWLGVLGVAVLAHPRRRLLRTAACVAVILALAAGGYAALAKQHYRIDLNELPAWATGRVTGAAGRHASKEEWGTFANLRTRNVKLVATNTAIYSVLLPGLENTGDRHAFRMMRRVRFGQAALAAYLAFLVAALAAATHNAIRAACRRDLAAALPLGLALTWCASRVLFYTWWNPAEPFLFAVMSLPAVWLVWCLATEGASPRAARVGIWAYAALAAIVWAHNLAHMILPLRALPG